MSWIVTRIKFSSCAIVQHRPLISGTSGLKKCLICLKELNCMLVCSNHTRRPSYDISTLSNSTSTGKSVIHAKKIYVPLIFSNNIMGSHTSPSNDLSNRCVRTKDTRATGYKRHRPRRDHLTWDKVFNTASTILSLFVSLFDGTDRIWTLTTYHSADMEPGGVPSTEFIRI